MTASPRELRRLRTFYVGEPGSGDLRAACVIDGRDYTDPDEVRADVGAAVGELHRRHLAAQLFTEPVDRDSPRPDLPTWQDWAHRHPREVADPPGESGGHDNADALPATGQASSRNP